MTESDIWKRIKPWLTGYSVRLENALSAGISDVLWCPLGLSVFLELKILESSGIIVRNSQVVFGIHASKSVPPYQHMFVVGDKPSGSLLCYRYSTVMKCKSITLESGKQKFYTKDAKPELEWSGAYDVCNYIKFLEKAKRDDTVI